MPRPGTADYPAFYGRYINQVSENDLEEAFRNQALELPDFLNGITEQMSMHAYAEGKWTIKELLEHVIDAERIFSYRALCIARKESLSLPPFDENAYAENSHANAREWQNLADEFIHLRRSTEDLFNSFNAEMLWQKGLVNQKSISVLSLGFITIGHFTHHKKIIEERYL